MELAIGIDTGGTCTDAILYDFDSGRVLGQNKALTTYDDLTRGILAALDGLNADLCRKAKVAGLSTTLATNACVEGKFRRTRLLLIGIDRHGIEKYGAEYGFTDPDDICYLPCRTTITGQIQQEPDWETLRAQAQAWFSNVEACAICEIYGMRNGGVLEQKAAAIIEEQTGLPTVCASTLFGDLSSLERATSAVLNAGLLPVTRDFLDAVTTAFRERQIQAEVMIVRSDSSLMSQKYSAEHAVETLLSGPAASALGGSALTGRRHAVVVDMGGTTTDVALIEEGMPLLSEDGIRVGQWKTLVKGLFSTSFALGGDSAIHWDHYGNLTIGPNRVLPLCVLADANSSILPVLRQQLRDVPTHSLPLHEFFLLNRQNWKALSLTPIETKLCTALEETPLSLQQAADRLGIDKYQVQTQSLEQAGVVLRAGLTPTDIMHVRGDYLQYNRESALLATRFAAASLKMDIEAFTDIIYEKIAKQVFFAVTQMLLEQASPQFHRHGLGEGLHELMELQWENRASGGTKLLRFCFQSPAAFIGIGGPIHLFLPTVAQALRAECIIPEGAATANAVGAVTGQMTATATAEIRPHGLSPEDDKMGDFEVLCPGQQTHYFEGEAEAMAWAEQQLRNLTIARVREQGATGGLDTTASIEAVQAGSIKLCTRVKVISSTCLRRASSEGETSCML